MDSILAMTILAMWLPHVVCGMLDTVILGLLTPMSHHEVDVVSQPGYQGVCSQVLAYCLQLLLPLPGSLLLADIGNNAQLQLALLIVVTLQASCPDTQAELARITQYTGWTSALGISGFFAVSFLLLHHDVAELQTSHRHPKQICASCRRGAAVFGLQVDLACKPIYGSHEPRGAGDLRAAAVPHNGSFWSLVAPPCFARRLRAAVGINQGICWVVSAS